MAYGIIFWGNSPCSIHIFKLQGGKKEQLLLPLKGLHAEICSKI
jgi:hypothetical protein